MNKIVCLLLIICFYSCERKPETEKIQKKRNNIVDVRDRVKQVELEEPIGRVVWPNILGDYLIIGDYNSYDKVVHIFNKDDFKYVTSVGDKGQGPYEITVIGHVAVDEVNHIFYVNDWGKKILFGFHLDSVLANPSYLPFKKLEMVEGRFPSRYKYMSDTLSICETMEMTGRATFQINVGRFNLNTGEIRPVNYEHPEIERRRIHAAGSLEYGIYVECYSHHDLVTIGNLDGDLKYNIYGNRWNNKTSNSINFYGDVMFCKDKIVALYYDGVDHYIVKDGRETVNYPRKMIIFDPEGEYIQTLNLGYDIVNFCYDKKHNRILMILEEDIQFGYLDLDGII